MDNISWGKTRQIINRNIYNVYNDLSNDYIYDEEYIRESNRNKVDMDIIDTRETEV